MRLLPIIKASTCLFLCAVLLTTGLSGQEQERITQNPGLIEKFHPANEHDFETGEHFFINMLVGAFTGGVFGAAGGLTQFKDDDTTGNENNLLKFGAIGGATGLIGGAVISFFEYRKDLQFNIGKDVLDHTWYGGLGGAMLGGLVGLIPYSSSKKTEDILQFTGYGALAGVAVGLGVYALFSLPRAEYMKMNFNTWYNPGNGTLNFSFNQKF